ncbi:MAG: alpha/beta hydrolase [Edafosvirus sp.]|uniref:Alpha/beta hydrolase n=1 Tax=Edafosvirus sp. TaxID=2487765 RepID=A0A3G4ZUQ5_9VIRU|nr:MAG: alpha/beta hydrolase [Edafosvirus sp.]
MLLKLLIFTGLFITCLSTNNPPYYKLSIEHARHICNNVPKNYPNQIIAEVYDTDISILNSTIPIRIIRPPNVTKELPVIFYFHGGGWVLGNRFTHDHIMRKIATSVKTNVIYIEYPLSPENKYPDAIVSSILTMRYMIDNHDRYNLDINKIAIVGDSAGANLAIITTYVLNYYKWINIDYLILLFPVTDATMTSLSYDQHINNIWLSKEAMNWFYESYLNDYETEKLIPYVSPIHIPINQLHVFPSVLIVTAENDVLRDEGETFAHNLMMANVDVVSVRFLGTIHDFITIPHFRETSATKMLFSIIINGLKEHLKIEN